MSKKILVTAATGDTGRHTVRILLEKGHAVRALAHNPDSRSAALEKLGAEVVYGDLLDLNFVTEATKGRGRRVFLLSNQTRHLASHRLFRPGSQRKRPQRHRQYVADFGKTRFAKPRCPKPLACRTGL